MIFECERNLISRTLAFERPDFGAGRDLPELAFCKAVLIVKPL